MPGRLASTISKSISFLSRPSSSIALSMASFSFFPSNSLMIISVSLELECLFARLPAGLDPGLRACLHHDGCLAGVRFLLFAQPVDVHLLEGGKDVLHGPVQNETGRHIVQDE